MDYAEVYRCIQVLKAKPVLFFRKENIVEKLECFDTIQKIGSPSVISSLVEFLRSENGQIRAKAAETILFLFIKLKSLNEYESTLKSLPIKTNDLDFYRIDFEEEIYVQLLCIASLNSNGYVREKAVRELGRMKNVVGLKFILFRLGDWVTQVRKAATEAIDLYLDRTYTDELLKQLPTINWLLVVERVDLREVYNRITDFILSQDLSEEFYLKIKQLDDKARFYFFKTFLSNFPSSEHLSWLMGDKNFLVRLELVKHLSNLNEVTQKELIARLLSDQSARVRLEALYASKRFSPDFEEQIILLLSDESASVRELSRHLLKGKGLDFAALYRQRIEGKQFLPGSLLGLSETGNSEDVPIFEQYINANNSKLVVACLSAINKFDEVKAKHYSLKLLVHPINQVREKAVVVLAKSGDTETLEKIRNIYAIGNAEIKKSVLKLFGKIGGWYIVGDLLLALTDDNIEIQNLSWQLLYKWKLKAIRLFTTPPKKEIERANEIYQNLEIINLRITQGRKELLQDLKLYLR